MSLDPGSDSSSSSGDGPIQMRSLRSNSTTHVPRRNFLTVPDSLHGSPTITSTAGDDDVIAEPPPLKVPPNSRKTSRRLSFKHDPLSSNSICWHRELMWKIGTEIVPSSCYTLPLLLLSYVSHCWPLFGLSVTTHPRIEIHWMILSLFGFPFLLVSLCFYFWFFVGWRATFMWQTSLLVNRWSPSSIPHTWSNCLTIFVRLMWFGMDFQSVLYF